jgi:hypothetical protein
VSLTEPVANPATASKAGFLASLCGSHPAKRSAAPETSRGGAAPLAPGPRALAALLPAERRFASAHKKGLLDGEPVLSSDVLGRAGFPRVYFRSTLVTGPPQAKKATKAGKARKARRSSHGQGRKS